MLNTVVGILNNGRGRFVSPLLFAPILLDNTDRTTDKEHRGYGCKVPSIDYELRKREGEKEVTWRGESAITSLRASPITGRARWLGMRKLSGSVSGTSSKKWYG